MALLVAILGSTSHGAKLEHFAVVAGLTRNPKLTAAVKFRHHRHHGNNRLAPAVLKRGVYALLFAEPDQISRGRKRQFEPAAFAACQRLARRKPNRVGGFLAVMRADLLRRCGSKKEPGVEPLRHALRRDPVRIGHQFVHCQQHLVLWEYIQKRRLALAEGSAMGSLELGGTLGIDQRVRSFRPREQNATFLEGLADRSDSKTQGSAVQPLAAGIEPGPGNNLLIALIDAAAGKHQRARIEIDLIVAHHHEQFDFIGSAAAQQQDGGGGTRCYGVGGHELPLLASSLILRSGRSAASRRMKRYAAHGSRRATARSSP